MRRISWAPSFERAFRRAARKSPDCQRDIIRALRLMETDVFALTLQTHKLSGKLAGLYACSCGYDCRIVFSLEKDPSGSEAEDVILMINIGSHDEVY